MHTRSRTAGTNRVNLEEVLLSLEMLSAVVQPTLDRGREAVRVLVELIEHPERAPNQCYLPARLSLLRSCGCGREPALNAAELATGGVAI